MIVRLAMFIATFVLAISNAALAQGSVPSKEALDQLVQILTSQLHLD